MGRYKIEFELPDNETVLSSANGKRVYWSLCGYDGYATVERAADVREVVHGHWIVTGRTNIFGGIEVTCPNCKDSLMVQDVERV